MVYLKGIFIETVYNFLNEYSKITSINYKDHSLNRLFYKIKKYVSFIQTIFI